MATGSCTESSSCQLRRRTHWGGAGGWGWGAGSTWQPSQTPALHLPPRGPSPGRRPCRPPSGPWPRRVLCVLSDAICSLSRAQPTLPASNSGGSPPRPLPTLLCASMQGHSRFMRLCPRVTKPCPSALARPRGSQQDPDIHVLTSRPPRGETEAGAVAATLMLAGQVCCLRVSRGALPHGWAHASAPEPPLPDRAPVRVPV